ncbi:MAG: HEAT repeat domain-containing protein [Candidatus Hydrogenedentes bacterium]|nr:HEAT repeat domain-containing protein [Candidatus Hydrogenedentota bacterium]
MNTAERFQSALSILSSEPILGRLFVASVEMAVLAGLVWVAIHAGIVRSPRWQSLLWLLVLVKPLVAVSLGALLPVIQLEAAPPVTPASREVFSRDSARLAPSSDDTKPAHAVEERAAWVEKGNASAPVSTDSVPPYARAWRWPWGLLRTLVTAWATGAFLLATYVVFDRIRLWRLIAAACPAPEALGNQYRELVANLGVGKPPRLRITSALESPALAGVLRPTILLPGWLADKPWNSELEWSLRHELAHWKLGDSLANAARQAAQVFFFFHPVTWWAGRKWQEAAELACDRAVVHTESEVEDYAGNLYQVLAQIHGQRRGLLASGLFATRTQIGRRIAELLSDPLKYPARLGARGLVVLMAVAAISLAVGSSFASGKEETPATSAITVEVQKNIQHAIEMLSTTSEFERDKVKAVFDIVRAQPNRPALDALCEWLKSDVATKRRSAVHIIGALPWEDASPAFQPLQDLLTHKENSTRGMAALTLATIGGSASYDAIVGMAQKDTDAYARRCAAWALGELGDPKALEPLQTVSKDPDTNVARNAENAIDRLTFLRNHAGATGDAKQVVRGIWLVAGSTPWDETRLGRAVDSVRSAAPDVRKALLDEAASNPSTAIKNSASYVMQKLADTASPASGAGAPSPSGSANTPHRDWGPEQATGAPDTNEAGDIVTAWASLTPDEQPEWLLLKYDVSVIPKGVKIYETYNPGAVNKVSVLGADGKEVNVWEGPDPTPTGKGKGVSEIAFTTPFKVNAVKIYLDSPRVQGWNEIDAVGLVDESGKEHWASSAEASTTFAERTHESRHAQQEPAKPQGQASVTVLGVDGQPAGSVSIDALRLDTSAENLAEKDAIVWREGEARWAPRLSTGGRGKCQLDNLEPGRYRFVAQLVNEDRRDPTPLGVSDAVQIEEGQTKEVVVRLQGREALAIRFIDSEAGKAISTAWYVLYREDGLPIGRASNYNNWTSDDGTAHFRALMPGRYRLQAKRQADYQHDAEYSQEGGPTWIEVTAGRENAVEIHLKPHPLSEAEQMERWPFSVFGTVTDEAGNPAPDVEIRASCGMGTLMPTGNTRSGADGKYLLRFGPGMHSFEDSGRERVNLQAATIHASKPGFYEKNLCRQGGLGMANVRPEKTDGWPASPTQIVVPNEPYRLDFIMTPAAQVRGKLLDAAGKPVVGQRITVTGPELGPSSSALTSLQTIDEGLFSFEAPCKPFRLELNKPPADGKTTLMNLQKPGHYEIILTLEDTSGAARVKVQAQSVPSGMTKESLLALPPIELPAGLPKGVVALSTGDGTAEDKRSLGASGHAIRFSKPKDVRFVEAVQFCGSRYGTAEPPKDNFHVYILNEQFQVLGDLPFPYAMVERGDMKWYTLRTPSIEVPEQFSVAIAFNPSDTKGIYLGMDKDVEQSHSYQGLPEDGFEPVKDTFDWTVRVFMSNEASGEKGVQHLADWTPPKTVNAFEGLTEAKYDTGNSDGKQSYGGRGPRIELALGTLVPGAAQLKGFRVYGSRYGSGFDPQTTMFKSAVLDKTGAVICEQQFPYSLFSYKEKWVDLVLTTPLSLDKTAADGGAISVALDPEATQFKGIYFHYNKDPQVSHSSRGTIARGFEPVPDREWMIRAYVTLAK